MTLSRQPDDTARSSLARKHVCIMRAAANLVARADARARLRAAESAHSLSHDEIDAKLGAGLL
jgi:hypothetical protein